MRDPRGLAIAKRLIAMSDIVAEGFSPGVLEKWGLGYDVLRSVRPDIIYVKQSGMGSQGTYGRLRTVGPIAAAFAGNSEQSGLPEPALPAGWGYSYLDWMGAYSFALAIISALYYRNATGRGQWIDASQCEAGLFVAGTSYLDWAANHRTSQPHREPVPVQAGGAARRLSAARAPTPGWPSPASRSRSGGRSAASAGRDEWPGTAGSPRWPIAWPTRTSWTSSSRAGPPGVDAFRRCRRFRRPECPPGSARRPPTAATGILSCATSNWMTELPGTKIGTWPVPEVPVRMSGATVTVGGTGRGAPIYGEDNAYVYGGFSGCRTRRSPSSPPKSDLRGLRLRKTQSNESVQVEQMERRPECRDDRDRRRAGRRHASCAGRRSRLRCSRRPDPRDHGRDLRLPRTSSSPPRATRARRRAWRMPSAG